MTEVTQLKIQHWNFEKTHVKLTTQKIYLVAGCYEDCLVDAFLQIGTKISTAQLVFAKLKEKMVECFLRKENERFTKRAILLNECVKTTSSNAM